MTTTANVINGIDVSKHLGLIGVEVRNTRWAICASLEWGDLFQAGFFGLIRAAEKFDANRGCRFSTYAIPWVRHHVRRAAMNQARTVRIPIWIQERRRAGARRFPIAATPLHPEDADSLVRIELVAGDADPLTEFEAAERRRVVERAINQLPERLRGVLRSRFWHSETLADIGRRLGVSRERARQLEAEALILLRQHLPEAP
jgi:RNA polymerase primary sigma factor